MKCLTLRTNLIKISGSIAFEGRIKDHCTEQKRERRVLIKFSFEPCKLINKFPDWKKIYSFKRGVFVFVFVFSSLSLSWLLSQRGANPKNYTAVLFLFPLPFIMEHSLQILPCTEKNVDSIVWRYGFHSFSLSHGIYFRLYYTLFHVIHYFTLYIIPYYTLLLSSL